MVNKLLANGLVSLGAGLLLSSLSSLLEHFAILGSSTDLARGLLDGLAVVAYGVATWFLVRSRKGA